MLWKKYGSSWSSRKWNSNVSHVWKSIIAGATIMRWLGQSNELAETTSSQREFFVKNCYSLTIIPPKHKGLTEDGRLFGNLKVLWGWICFYDLLDMGSFPQPELLFRRKGLNSLVCSICKTLEEDNLHALRDTGGVRIFACPWAKVTTIKTFGVVHKKWIDLNLRQRADNN